MNNNVFVTECDTCGISRSLSRTARYHWIRGIGRNCRSCAYKGNQKRLGTKNSIATRRKMSLASAGRKKTLKHAQNISIGLRKLHGTTKDFSRTERRERTKFRENMQLQIFHRDNFTCQICNQYGGNLQVDHIKSWAKYPKLRFDATNCRTLCMGCHYYVTLKRKIPDGIVWGHNLSRRVVS